MSSFTNPRRSTGMTPTTRTCRKGATFHSPEPSENPYFSPPSLPRRSQTSLEDVTIDEKRRRAALALEDFDRIDGASPSASPTVQSYRDEGLPFPQGLLQNTINPASDYSDRMDYIKQESLAPLNERKASLRPQRQTRRAAPTFDSGLGSSIVTNKSSVGGAVGAITMSAAPASKTHLQRMSRHTRDIVNQHILQKLLAEPSYKDFHPIVGDCPRAIDQREIVCLRDLEKTLTLSAPHRAKTADLYYQFCMSTITHVRTALTIGLNDHEQTRPQDRPYTEGYFTDLVAQVRQAALQISASREKEAKGEELDETDVTASDEFKLYGGLTENGRPAEIVRIRNGKAISMKTREPVDMDEAKSHPMKRSLSEDDEETESVYRSMARRKKSATAAELAPKRCRHQGCDKKFKRPCDLTKHEKTHSRPWKCSFPDCRYAKDGWPTEKELLRHQNDRHSKAPKMYKCHFSPCTYESKRESNAKQHMEKSHGWEYKRSKSNGKKRKDDGSVQMATPSNTGAPTPSEQDLNDEYENQNNGSVRYEQSVYSPDGYGIQNNGSTAYENSAYSPEYPALSDFSPNFNDDMEFDIIPRLHVPNYTDSPNSSNLRHGSTDSSIPSPYGGDNLNGFHIENGNGAYTDFPIGNNFDLDFDLFNNDYATSHMRLPEPSVYQQQLPEFTGSSCSNNAVQQISPGGHGNHVLYTPTSLQNVDEGFEDYAPGDDFALFPSTTTSSTDSMSGMNAILPARVPLFGEISSTQEMYPTFLNTQDMDLNWDMN